MMIALANIANSKTTNGFFRALEPTSLDSH